VKTQAMSNSTTSNQNGENVARRQVSGTSTENFAAGHQVFDAGSGHGMVYIVRAGSVRLYKQLPDGRSINLGILGPNTVFTQEDASNGIASGAVAEAMVESTILIVPVDELVNVIASSPELAAAMVTGMTRRLTEMQTLVEHLLIRDASVRLAVTLVSLATRFGRSTPEGSTQITLPVTHLHLASMIGSNRVTVSRKLSELQNAGLVRSTGRNSLAVDIAGLRAYAQSATGSQEK
jgi:CRP/FNR family transcriptional regulator